MHAYIHICRLQPTLNKILQNVYHGHFWVRTLWVTFVHSFPSLTLVRNIHYLWTWKQWKSTTVTQWAPALGVSHLNYHGTFSHLSPCEFISFQYDMNSLKCRSSDIHPLRFQQLLIISYQMRSSSWHLGLLLIFLQGCFSLELLDPSCHASEL